MRRVCALLLAAAPALGAQGVISGRAVLPNSTRPLACADAALRRADGTVVARTFTREDGTFEFAAPPAGRYVVAFSSLGMVEAVAPLDSLHPASDVDRTFAVPLDAVDSLVERVDALRSDTRYAQLARGSTQPRYPVAERDNGREGGVVAAVVVKADGRVDEAMSSFLYASAQPFEAAVREGFAYMLFEPAQVDGQARCSLLVTPYIFELVANGTRRSASYVLGEVDVLAPNVVTSLPVEMRGLCPSREADTGETAPIYLPCQVDREARETRNKAVLNWQPAPGEVQPTSCFRVEIRFVVGADGLPEPATVSLVSTNNSGFGAAFVALVPDLRYTPARIDGRPVRQVVTFKESVGVRVIIDTGIGIGSTTPSRSTRC